MVAVRLFPSYTFLKIGCQPFRGQGLQLQRILSLIPSLQKGHRSCAESVTQLRGWRVDAQTPTFWCAYLRFTSSKGGSELPTACAARKQMGPNMVYPINWWFP